MVPQWVIEKKRDGQALSAEEISYFIAGFTAGTIPDYQMAAMAMATYFQGMTLDETAALADCMLRSGHILDTRAIRRPKADKHSTGGIGDKVSLVLAPLVASCGLAVPMISGRSLAITGGTLDKLEAIPGFRTDLRETEFLRIVDEVGCAIIGQTAELAPADRKLYALRDVTGTVPSIPLITASIMSKKMAAGLDALTLDVKWGAGAFMKTREQAYQLAQSLVLVGQRMGQRMAALITDMNQPLGHAVGNAVEITEAIQALSGEGPDDLMEVTMALGIRMLLLAQATAGPHEALERLNRTLDSGAARECFVKMVAAQGGDPRIIDRPRRLPQARIQKVFPAPMGGYVATVRADAIGRAVLLLGAGRVQTQDPVDHAVGVTNLVKVGEWVERGQCLALLHANENGRLNKAEQALTAAFLLSENPTEPPPLINDSILPT